MQSIKETYGQLNWSEAKIPWKMSFMQRKSMAISLVNEGYLWIKVPVFLTDIEALNFVDNHRHRVLEWWTKAQKSLASTFRFEDGNQLYLWGRECTLRIGKGPFRRQRGCLFRHEELLVFGSGGQKDVIKSMVKAFYKKQTEEKARDLLVFYGNKVGIEPKEFHAKEQKSRWGSCTGEKKIYLNYRLAMLPHWALDYICAHEVCHLVHMDHSKAYYNLLGKILDTYQERQKMLHQESGKYIVF